MLQRADASAEPDIFLAENLLRQVSRYTQRGVKGPPTWRPQPGPQTEFLTCEADETLYGGAAGGGKTSSEVALPARYIHIPSYRALILRRETPQLNGIIDQAKEIYQRGRDTGRWAFAPFAPGRSSTFVQSPQIRLTFESGARIWFGHCKDPDDWKIYIGQEFDDICFDEVVQFTREQYLEIKSRLRGTAVGIKRRVVATSNPPKPTEPGATWVKERWGPWLDENFRVEDWDEVDETGAVVHGNGLPPRIEWGKAAPPAQSGTILYVALVNGKERFSATPFEWNGASATTRTFIRSSLADNPAMLETTPNYRATLRDNTPVRVEQLEKGDWSIKSAAGTMFQRAWCEFVDAPPPAIEVLRRIRYWDKAATEPHEGNEDPDWTVGVKLSVTRDGYYVIENAVRTRGNPGHVTATIKATAAVDGKECPIKSAQDPAAAGVSEASQFIKDLTGYTVSVARETGDKVTRFGPVSSQAHPNSTGGQFGRFRIVRGPWNEPFLSSLENFPDAKHDDDADALAGAFNEIAIAEPVPVIDTSSVVSVSLLRFGGSGGRGF